MSEVTALERIELILKSEFSMQNYVEFCKEIFDTLQIINPGMKQGVFNNYSSHIEDYSHVGNYSSPEGNNIAIFAVQLKTASYVENARSTQRSFARDLIESGNCDAAIVAFYSRNDSKWRLSFVRLDYEMKLDKGKFKPTENLTPAKRYSFLVGKDEPCHTAISRFRNFILDKNYNPSLDEIEEAFSVEKVTKEFFSLYCEKFYQLQEYLESNQDFIDESARCGFTSEQFAKKLMGQIVFLYFLQKKGWLGVKVWYQTLSDKEYNSVFYVSGGQGRIIKEYLPKLYVKTNDEYKLNSKVLDIIPDADEEVIANHMPVKMTWGDGSKKFLRTIFDWSQKHDGHFYENYLEPLFYNTLNKNRGELAYCPELHCRIPFLSGGLFDPIDNYDWKSNNFDIPDEMFSNKKNDSDREGTGILDIFDRYNFTMSEDEPMEREVAIDPEMLGKVFENLLEVKDRKSKGAFYTPREIVHYMCQESLINYLTESLKVSEEAVRDFILYGDFLKDEDTKKDKRTGDKEMYISEELFKVDAEGNIVVNRMKDMDLALKNVRVADPAVGSGAFPLGMLNEIVRARENISAYMAINMSPYDKRMMYQLERSPHTLKYETIRNCIFAADIEPSAVDIAQLRLWLSLVIDDEINPDAQNELEGHRNPLPLPNLECNILCGNSLIDEFEGVKLVEESVILGTSTASQISMAQERFDNVIHKLIETQDELFRCDDTEKKKELMNRIKDLKDAIIMSQLDGLDDEQKMRYEQTKHMASKPYVLWQLDFARIFKEKGGFDIIIGNPPYVNIVNLDAEYRNKLQKKYSINKNKVDLYAFFIEFATKIENNSGQIVFIIPHTWKATDSFEKLRKLIFDTHRVRQVVNLDGKVFDASVIPMIIQLNNGSNKSNYDIVVKNRSFETISLVQRDEVVSSDKYILDTESNYRDKKIFRDIEKDTECLGDILQFTRGIKTSNDTKFVLKKAENSECKKVLRGKNIKIYELNWSGEFLWYRPDLMKEKAGCVPHSKDLFEVPEKIVTQRISGMRMNVAYDNNQFYFLDTVNVSRSNTLKEGYKIKYILGLLNSTLINYWYGNKYRMPTVGLYELHSIPIKKIDYESQNELIKLVDSAINSNDEDDLKEAMSKIDEMVFAIYNISNVDKEYILKSFINI